MKWTGWDLNPGPPPCQSGILPSYLLDYRKDVISQLSEDSREDRRFNPTWLDDRPIVTITFSRVDKSLLLYSDENDAVLRFQVGCRNCFINRTWSETFDAAIV